MKLVPPGGDIPWWEAHPEHGFDWKGYRALEQKMIKKGELHPLSDLHQALDEDELMRAYDERAMNEMERRVRMDRAKQSPIRMAERSARPSPREILKDPAFAPSRPNPWRWAGLARGAGLGVLMGLFDKQSEMAKMGRDEDYFYGPHLPWGGEPTNENAYSRVRGKR